MAFPGTSNQSLEAVWSRSKATSGAIKDRADAMIASTSVTRRAVLDYLNGLADALAALAIYAATPGIAAYAQAQENKPTLNVSTEYVAMRTQIIAVQDWIVANFPKDASGNAAVYSFDANKRFADVNLTAGQLTAFKAQLSALSATIE